MDMGRGEERVRCVESNMKICITICKIDSELEFAICLRKLKQGLCISLEGWDVEGVGREVQKEGDMYTYIHIYLIHIEIWQKTKFCKAIIFQ